VWLRANGVDHRLFGEDELWVGADPEFGMVENASFGCLRPGGTTALGVPDAQVYDALVGRARVQFVIRWVSVSFFSVYPHNTSVLTAASFICAGGSLSVTGVIDTRWSTAQAVSGTS
jgi:hypothetical protein